MPCRVSARLAQQLAPSSKKFMATIAIAQRDQEGGCIVIPTMMIECLAANTTVEVGAIMGVEDTAVITVILIIAAVTTTAIIAVITVTIIGVTTVIADRAYNFASAIGDATRLVAFMAFSAGVAMRSRR